ncbi:MAG: chromosome segregation protein SMC [Ilumatobacteraceae bacterium]|nr:chromosome segregation protein SMC [Ilumatobacteraceae bacterium]
MYLKRLTLKGFKSFAESTTMDLEPGVTVVVGPNGSGKSNVVDAIAWVLGAQAPKSVRSQKMDDVIFAGTASRPALGRAEVSITIDNSDGTLGLDLTEITVTRILFRTGESEYAINGAPCRLLDVQELLSDAGVGRQQHVIVSQGQIDAVLNARPEDRRSIIEEAAGVLKFRKRKEKAQRRLDATEANLLRVQDLLREVRRQLRPLERQAKAAERHGELVGELTDVKTFVLGREIGSWRTKLESLAAMRRDAASEEQRIKSELAALDTAVVALEAQLAATGANDVGDRLVRVEQLRERARGLAAVLVERRRSLERDRGQGLDAGVVASLEADVARFRDELAVVEVERAELAPLAQELAVDEQAFAAAEGAVAEEPEASEASASAATAAAEVRGELRSIRAAIERLEAEHQRLDARRTQMTDRRDAARAATERFRAECDAASHDEAPLADLADAAEERRVAATADHEGRVEARQRLSEEASRWSARVEALQQAVDAARARAGAERLAEVDGVLGTLLELVEIDAGWEPAVEAALGDALTAVVVDDPGAGRRALDELRSSETSGAVLAIGASGAARPASGVGDPVRSHVRGRGAGVDGLLDALLANAVRAGDVPAAIDIVVANPDLVVVTPDGDRLASTGWRVGAASGGATAAALEDARDRAEAAERERAGAARAVDDATVELAAARAAEGEITRQLDANDARLAAAAEGLAQAQGEAREAAAEVETLESAIADADGGADRERARITELEALLPALESDEAAESEAARARRAQRAELDARRALLTSRRSDLDVRTAGLDERQQLLSGRLTETEQRLADDAEARVRAEERRVAIERSLVAIDRLAAVVEAHRTVVEAHHDRLFEERRRQSDEVRELTEQLGERRSTRHEAERTLEELRERVRQAELGEAEATLRLETTIETLRRDLDIEPATAEAAKLPELPEGATPAGRVRELERELKLLGPINPLALEEFNELQTRHGFLEEQLEDVRSTRRELSRVIQAIDAEIQNVFASAFADVSENFTQLFGLLFPGGTGRLALTAPDDLLNTGIEIEAKPSGKNVKKLSLLSGGERSLTALAYLFAVFRSRPSPFYVMDEVEAALDDVNLHRFLGLVAEFRSDAQLIIVSHQKRTMEAGDILLGVSMQPGGSSKVITEKRELSSV